MLVLIPLIIAAVVVLDLASAGVLTTTTSPAFNADFADPSILNAENNWFAYSTGSNGANVQVAISPDGISAWQLVNGYDAMPNLPNWVDRGAPLVWSPNVVMLGDHNYLLYFSAKSARNPAIHCVGTATSSDPLGPFSSDQGEFACHDSEGGAIDPAGYYDPSTNRRFVVYKVDGNNFGNGGNCNNGNDPIHSTPIMLQEVAGDGFSHIGDPVQILDRDDRDGPLVEAPSIGRLGDKYFLFFSSNCYDGPYYDISFAVADSIFGPYEKRGPLLLPGDFGFYSPGGLDIASDGSHVAFHAGSVGARLMYTGQVTFNGGTAITFCASNACKDAN